MLTNNPDLYILQHAWKEYVSHRPADRTDTRKTLISAWRESAWIIEGAWRGMMQRVLPPTAWNFLSEALDRRAFLRQVWLQEGGWLFTRAGTRRKRHFKGQRRPRVGRMQEEVNKAYSLFRQSTDSATLAEIDIVLLAASGVFYCGKNGPRRRTVTRHRDTWGKPDWVRARLTDLPAGVLQLPWRRRRLR